MIRAHKAKARDNTIRVYKHTIGRPRAVALQIIADRRRCRACQGWDSTTRAPSPEMQAQLDPRDRREDGNRQPSPKQQLGWSGA